jgi:hypothetical protein
VSFLIYGTFNYHFVKGEKSHILAVSNITKLLRIKTLMVASINRNTFPIQRELKSCV